MNTEGVIRIVIYHIDQAGIIKSKVVHNSPDMCRVGYSLASDPVRMFVVGGLDSDLISIVLLNQLGNM